MTIDYRLSMRWADIDQLGHVNNVVYLDYAEEARLDLASVRDLHPMHIGIDYVRPAVLSPDPVVVEQKITDGRLDQRITQEIAGERIEFARVQTHFGQPGEIGASQIGDGVGVATQLECRRGDLDGDGHVDPVKVFEYFQEARVQAFSSVSDPGVLGRVVVAHTSTDFGPAVGWQEDPWRITMRIGRIGTKSYTVDSEWCDGERVLARNHSVLVAFDVHAQTSRAWRAEERDFLSTFA